MLYLTRCAILILTLISIAAAQGSQNAKVLVVHSYEKEHVCGAPQANGIVSALHERGWMDGKNMTLKSYYMDTKKTHTSPEAIRRQAQAVLQTVENFKPDVVVVLDDNAIREVMLPLINREDIAVVFTGMNGQPENYNEGRHFMESREKPGSNITGVYEKLHVSKSLVVMEAALSGFAPEDKVIGITDSRQS
jgi:ABC-type uncharacterized transport system substrate-binding protein